MTKKLSPSQRGVLGAHARNIALSPERRSELARNAALARHAKRRKRKV